MERIYPLGIVATWDNILDFAIFMFFLKKGKIIISLHRTLDFARSLRLLLAAFEA